MRCFILISLLGIRWLGAITEPPLPVWDEEERARMAEDGWVAGSTLLSYDPLPEVREEGDTPLAVEEPTEEEIGELTENENVVDEKYLAAYFAERPDDYVVDPQRLVGTERMTGLQALLEDHARESAIEMRVYVFGANQVIPGDVREEEVVERLYSEGMPAIVVYYYLGDPQRSDIYLSPVLTDAVSAAEQRRALQSSVVEALTREEPLDQLVSFLGQMSIRAYWMERMTQGTADETENVMPESEEVSEVEMAYETTDKVLIPDWGYEAIKKGILVVGALLLGYLIFLFWRKRARYAFPDFDIESRLGGDHAAGIGAIISFSKKSASPSIQRNQVPEYMRRAR